jgi:serine protease Do
MQLTKTSSPLPWRRVVACGTAVLALGLTGALPVQAQVQAPSAPVRELPDFPDLVEKVGPAVVNIRTLERAHASRSMNGGNGMDEDLQDFFRRFGIPMPGQPGQPGQGGGQTPRRSPAPTPSPDDEPTQRGVGSGFILTTDGFVMTNAHVVEGADEVMVTLTDKREFKARIIGADKRTDVAVVKIEATGLPAVRIGDVNRIRVGEWVMAIGSPFGLENTVTAGIVSAKARDTGDFLPFIQTDVAINPGNSGGPLINMRGEVIGINSQIYSRSGGFMGISFAIPIDQATMVADQLRTTGRVSRGRIGVQIDQVTREVAESIGLGQPMGALVRSVEAGGPADKAGVEPGDIITKFDGKPIERAGELPRVVAASKSGSRANMQLFRRGAYKDLTVAVAELEPDAPRKVSDRPSPAKPAAPVVSVLGLAVTDLTDAQRKDLKGKAGVRVEVAEGAAARAGVKEGDIVLSIDNTEVMSAQQFGALVAKVDKAKPVSVLIRRGEWVNYVVIKPAR